MKLYYPSSENKGAGKLRSYCEADLRLCFRIGENPVFHEAAKIWRVNGLLSRLMLGGLKVAYTFGVSYIFKILT